MKNPANGRRYALRVKNTSDMAQNKMFSKMITTFFLFSLRFSLNTVAKIVKFLIAKQGCFNPSLEKIFYPSQNIRRC